MLKAFSRVFHKTQSHEDGIEGQSLPTNEPNGVPDQHGGQRVLERKQPAGLGVPRATGKGVGSPRSGNHHHPHSSYARPLAKDIAAAYGGKDLPRRTSFQQPKLHMKGPPPGSDGTYPLTSDNIEWHLRMIPPMKESKYDRILRYVHMQQQNVAVMADMVQRDIDASMLMSGQIPYDLDLASPPRHSFEQSMVVPQGQQPQVIHNGHPHAASSIGGVGMPGVVLHHPGGLPGGGHAYVPNNAMPPPPIQHTVTNNTNTSATPQLNIKSHDAEEDDDTPLAAINGATSPQQQQPQPEIGQDSNSGNGMVSTLERYAQEAADLPLPEPISPTNQARMSVVSFSSNMAANLHVSDMPVSRSQSQSHSLSNPQSGSLHESVVRMTPVARSPTVQEAGSSSQQFTVNPMSGQIQQSSFSSRVNNRPSLDAITPQTARPVHNGNGDEDDDDDDAPLLGKLNLGDVAKAQARAQQELEDEEDDNEPLQNQLRASKLVEPGQMRPEVDLVVNEFAAKMSSAFKSEIGDKEITQLGEACLVEEEEHRHMDGAGGDGNQALADSLPTLGLKVVNAVDNGDDSDGSANENEAADAAEETTEQGVVRNDEDDDNQPLAALSRHLSNGSMQPRQQMLGQNLNMVVMSDSMSAANTQLQSNIAEDGGDDDDQPLSSLLAPVQDTVGIDEFGYLPLPVPPSITDPNAVIASTGECISPGRASFGDRSMSPSLSSGIVRKPSSLSRSVNIAGDMSPKGIAIEGLDAPTNQSTPNIHSSGDRRSSLLSKQPSNLSGYSLPVTSAAMVMGKTNSLPKSLRIAPAAGGISATLPSMSHGRTSFGIAAQDVIAEDENEIDAVQPAPEPAAAAAGQIADDGLVGSREIEFSADILDTAQLTGAGSVGRPWAAGSVFNRSSTSLSGKRAVRGSTLGQNLTDELHRIREDLARSRRDDGSSRRSWQSTVALGMRKPWMRHESARSETALDKPGSLGQHSAAAVLEQASLDDTTPGLSDLPAGWEQTNPRPMTAYHNRTSRWFGSHKKHAASDAQPKDDSAVVLSGSPQSASHSLTSRFNMKLGKLKKTFKHN